MTGELVVASDFLRYINKALDGDLDSLIKAEALLPLLPREFEDLHIRIVLMKGAK